MKKFLLILFGALIIAATGVSVYVSTIDWNQHKDKIASQLQEITGKKIVFSGPVSMTVFPTPSLNASNIKVYSSINPDKEEPLMTIDNVVADLSFSALLGGSFDVKMMSLVKPEINFRRTRNGFNWVDEAQINTNAEVNDVVIALESVMLQDAKINITDDVFEKSTELDNLNAEIVADSLKGPFRIDGSYTKDGKPEGFAISVGNLSDNFATNLNFVLNQPSSESYLRFDGTFLPSNNAVNGNLVLESKKLKALYDSMVENGNLPQHWDTPIEVSTELKVNKTQIEFASVIIKYGNSVGAGNIIIPLGSKSYIIGEDKSNDKQEVAVKFEMTDLDLDPIFKEISGFVQKQMQKDVIYSPDFPYNAVIDISALKATYNNQFVKDLSLRLSLQDNVWQLTKIGGVFPGTTTISATGRLFSVEDTMSYTLSTEVQTAVLRKFLEWLHLPVKTVVNSTYQKAELQATIAGTSKAIQISPFTLFLDNTSITGQAGAKLGEVPHYAIEAATDSVILDNYFPKVFNENSDWKEVVQDLWQKSAWFNNIDLDVDLRVGLLIYEGVSLDRVALKATSQKGTVNIENLSIGEFLKSNLNLSGEFSGLGQKLQFKNLKYEVNASDYLPWLQKFEIQQPDWNLKYFQPFSSSGVASLNNDRLWLNITNKTGTVESSYNGRVIMNDNYTLNGDLQIVALNTSDFLKSLPIKYAPQDANLGRMQLKGTIAGTWDKFKLSDSLLSVSGNTFQGVFGADNTRQIPHYVADLKINRFEPERFLPSHENAPKFNVDKVSSSGNSLWNKPNLSDVPFDREKLQKITFVSNLDLNELVYKNRLFKSVTMQLENKNNELLISKFQSKVNDGSVTADLKYSYADKPILSGDIHVINQSVRDMNWIGNTYGITSGMAEFDVNINTSALSPRDILDNFSGTLNLNIDSPIIKGFNLAAISEDLVNRKNSDGFQNVLRDNLQQGETSFNKFSGQINLKDGNWQIDRAWLKSNDASVDISGTGNLQAWNMDSQFSVQLSEPKNVKPFSFDLKGTMSAPELETDASQIIKVYDEQKAQKEAEVKAKEEAHYRDLLSKMDVQLKSLADEKELFDNFVHGEYLALKEKLSKDEYVQELSVLDQRVQKQLSEFDKADLISKEKEIQDGTPLKVAQIVEKAKNEKAQILDGIQKIYLLDLKKIIQDNYKEIQSINAKKDKVMQENLNKHEAHVIRLNNIETGYRFQTDAMYNQLLNAIDERLKNYDAITQNVERYGATVNDEDDIPLLEKYKEDSSEMLSNATSQEAFLEDDIKRYLTYVDEKLKVEEKIFKDKKEAEEKAKKIEENTGTISAPAKGTVQKVVRSIEEIEKTGNPGETDEEYEPKIEVNLFGDEPSAIQASGTISKK